LRSRRSIQRTRA